MPVKRNSNGAEARCPAAFPLTREPGISPVHYRWRETTASVCLKKSAAPATMAAGDTDKNDTDPFSYHLAMKSAINRQKMADDFCLMETESSTPGSTC